MSSSPVQNDPGGRHETQPIHTDAVRSHCGIHCRILRDSAVIAWGVCRWTPRWHSERGIQAAETGDSLVYRLPPIDANVRQVVVTAMAVDPRGEFIAAAGDDHIIRILDVPTMQVAYVLGDGERGEGPETRAF